VKFIDEAAGAILVNDQTKNDFLARARRVNELFKAALPDRDANSYYQSRTLLLIIAEKVVSLLPVADITKVMAKVDRLLDESVAAEAYQIREKAHVDLTKIDFETLRRRFDKGQKRIEAERLRRLLENKVALMIRLNKSRMDYHVKLQEMIAEYNAGSVNVEMFFKNLIEFTRSLQAEDQRAVRDGLTEEEQAILDLLTKPDPKLTQKQEAEVKKVARELLETLKREKLVLDWRKKQQSRAAVEVCIKDFLDRLPAIYTPELYQQKWSIVYQHVFDSYTDSNQSIYATAA